ncbi:DUF996 domain-containing protein [Thermococcus sp.]|uniref:DUF996 domain-containing protein n=1 Tax=Thermococcus sp. TaxID=35749 RepID=UPI0026391C63|nr:DUF996 domain-containing protein [Thermococcus sp.]
MDVRREKSLGLVGSILVLIGGFLGIIPYVGVFLGTTSLIGQVLILIALKGLGDKLGDERPFRYYLYAVVVSIGIAAVAVVFMLIGIVSAPGFVDHPTGTNTIGIGLLGTAILLLLAGAIIGIYFTIKTWRAAYEITKIEEFKKTANFLMWGAITLIILVGLILLFVAAIYQILAFANMPEEIETGQDDEMVAVF